jgi:two-component system nitrogen regulation sensor histidine kinase NtrY
MARRIAHEVKNPLTPIQLSVDHIRRVWRAGDERFGAVLTECLENIRRQVGALRRIASEFSDYSRLPELQMEPTAVEAIIAETLDAYTAASPPGVVVRREVASDLPLLVVDRAVIVRALVNLVENALQAMPEGGTLSIGATLADGAAGGARIRIVVCDTGVGIESVVRARLFEPYFSTKSGGTGLGLAIARKAVEEHGGTIEIRSRAGEGTVVTLLLPVMGRPDTKATA